MVVSAASVLPSTFRDRRIVPQWHGRCPHSRHSRLRRQSSCHSISGPEGNEVRSGVHRGCRRCNGSAVGRRCPQAGNSFSTTKSAECIRPAIRPTVTVQFQDACGIQRGRSDQPRCSTFRIGPSDPVRSRCPQTACPVLRRPSRKPSVMPKSTSFPEILQHDFVLIQRVLRIQVSLHSFPQQGSMRTRGGRKVRHDRLPRCRRRFSATVSSNLPLETATAGPTEECAVFEAVKPGHGGAFHALRAASTCAALATGHACGPPRRPWQNTSWEKATFSGKDPGSHSAPAPDQFERPRPGGNRPRHNRRVMSPGPATSPPNMLR